MKLAAVFAIVVGAASCGPRSFGCDVAGVAIGLDDAVTLWPDVADIAERVDVFCVEPDAIDSVSRCGLSRASEVEACTMWVGSATARARIYVRDDVDVAAAIVHEAQHWHLWDDVESNACETHAASCGWEE